VQWRKPVIPANQEAETGQIEVQHQPGQLGKKLVETPISANKPGISVVLATWEVRVGRP
jgi:hypothetical protein